VLSARRVNSFICSMVSLALIIASRRISSLMSSMVETMSSRSYSRSLSGICPGNSFRGERQVVESLRDPLNLARQYLDILVAAYDLPGQFSHVGAGLVEVLVGLHGLGIALPDIFHTRLGSFDDAFEA
jgi:hypothetical protein